MITGSIGMIPSSSLGDGPAACMSYPRLCPRHRGQGHRQPHRLHPLRRHDAALLLRYGRGADAIENAVNKVLDKGLRTADNMSEGCTCLGCTAMGDAILAEI